MHTARLIDNIKKLSIIMSSIIIIPITEEWLYILFYLPKPRNSSQNISKSLEINEKKLIKLINYFYTFKN